MRLKNVLLVFAVLAIFADVASAQFCANCARSKTVTRQRSYGSSGGISYGSTGGVSYGSSGGSYSGGSSGGTFVTSYGSSGGSPTQIIRRPRLFQRRNFVERSVVTPVVEVSESTNATEGGFPTIIQCPFCGRAFALKAVPTPFGAKRAGCGCCDKCTGQPGCNCGCANCTCNDTPARDSKPLNPDRPPGYKADGATAAPEK